MELNVGIIYIFGSIISHCECILAQFVVFSWYLMGFLFIKNMKTTLQKNRHQKQFRRCLRNKTKITKTKNMTFTRRQIQIRNILQYSFFTTLRDFINNVSSFKKTLY